MGRKKTKSAQTLKIKAEKFNLPYSEPTPLKPHKMPSREDRERQKRNERKQEKVAIRLEKNLAQKKLDKIGRAASLETIKQSEAMLNPLTRDMMVSSANIGKRKTKRESAKQRRLLTDPPVIPIVNKQETTHDYSIDFDVAPIRSRKRKLSSSVIILQKPKIPLIDSTLKEEQINLPNENEELLFLPVENVEQISLHNEVEKIVPIIPVHKEIVEQISLHNEAEKIVPIIPVHKEIVEQISLPNEVEKIVPIIPVHKENVICVNRSEDINIIRESLPIVAEEQEIMEAIQENDVLIIQGETGSGKTTQVPQFLFEAGYSHKGMIGITQPRRVAAIAMASRVATELGSHGSSVCYQIRFDSHESPQTQVKFMTDGILLREIQTDFLLLKYSVIIIDEAHERNVNTDLLIGLLSRMIKLRNSRNDIHRLKLIIMSATLNVDDFVRPTIFSPPPPIVNVPSRQHNVHIHFNKVTTNAFNYFDSTIKKVIKIHKSQPPGNILVFLTGRREIILMCSKLRERLKSQQDQTSEELSIDFDEAVADLSDLEKSEEEEENVDETDIACLFSDKIKHVRILPLFSLLSPSLQQRVFEPCNSDTRMIVIATNVAETSITIPGIRYVVDCGRVKQKINFCSGASSYSLTWISQASANQRAGRAGRESDGHCYRLYSSAFFNDELPKFSVPEIFLTSLESTVLSICSLGISKVDTFPFITPPKAADITAAINTLRALTAVESTKSGVKLTELGKLMVRLPISPRFARMVAVAASSAYNNPDLVQLLHLTIAAVSILSVPEILDGSARSLSKTSDTLALLKLVAKCDMTSVTPNLVKSVCTELGLRHKGIHEALLLRKQLCYIIGISFDTISQASCSKFSVQLRKLFLSGLIDRVARRWPLNTPFSTGSGWEQPPSDSYQCSVSATPVFIHSESVLSPRGKQPDFLVFNELKSVESGRQLLCSCSSIESSWLPEVAPNCCEFSSPLLDHPVIYDSSSQELLCKVIPLYKAGPHQWTLQPYTLPFPKDHFAFTRFFLYSLLNGDVVEGFKLSNALCLEDISRLILVDPRDNKKLSHLTTRRLLTLVNYFDRNNIHTRETLHSYKDVLGPHFINIVAENATARGIMSNMLTLF